MRWRALAATAVLIASSTAVGLPSAAAATAGCAVPVGVYTGSTAWAQALLQPTRVWPIASGAGQTVAVVSTGIDAANAQFGPGQVSGGADVLPGARSDPRTDCDGRGTFAAGIVAARPDAGTTFAGIAPAASLLAVRVVQATGTEGDAPAPDVVAAGIVAAVALKATVILVGVPSPVGSDALQQAVASARAAGVVVVSPAAQTQAGAISYPTAYPGVIGVGGVGRDGAAVGAEGGDYVSLAGPGADLVSTAAGATGTLGHAYPVNDASFAAAFVAGAVAVLRSARPELTPDQVAAQLTYTADHPPTGRDPRLGWGTVDLVAALAADLPAAVASPGSGADVVAASPSSVVPLAAPRPAAAPGRLGGVLALLGVGLAGVACVAALTVRRGRRRGWRAGHAS